MEDAELATIQSATAIEPTSSGLSFDPRTQKLLDYLTEKSKRLSDMLKGAWATLARDEVNPDLHAQVAHSVRELMEKAPKDLATLPMQLNSGELVGQIRIISTDWKAAAIPVNDKTWNGLVTEEQRKLLVDIDSLLIDFDSKYPPNEQRRSALIQALDGSTTQIPEQIMAERVEVWNNLSGYFIGVSHHTKITTTDDLRDNLVKVEQLLLDILTPEVIPVLDDIDALVDSVETA